MFRSKRKPPLDEEMEARKQAVLVKRNEDHRLESIRRAEQDERERVCGSSPVGHVYEFSVKDHVGGLWCIGCDRRLKGSIYGA